MGAIKFVPLILFSAILLVPIGAPNALAILFGGIEFPDGAISFADAVLTYDNTLGGSPPTDINFLDPAQSLGIPDYVDPIGSVSLGSGGLLEVEFIDNVLTNDGGPGLDIHIFEIGPDIEDTFVSIRPTAATALLLGAGFDTGVPGVPATIGDGFYEIGMVMGATDSIDIDSFFPAAAAGTYRFDAVQLIDDKDLDQMSGPTVGADIDAIGAISTISMLVGGTFIPIDTTALLLAGIQTNAVWIISALAIIGSLAFGAVYITAKRN